MPNTRDSRAGGSSARSSGPALRAVLLDIDGTLIDSNDSHARAWVDAGAELGYRIQYEDVRPLIGMGGDKVMPQLIGIESDSREGQAFAERRTAIFAERYLPDISAFPGTREMVERFREAGLKVVVATSANRKEMKKLLSAAGVEDLIDEATSSSDADASKPDPDIVTAALKAGGVDASSAVMLGDTPYDVAAAGRAGVGIIAFRCGGWTDETLRGALAVFDDPADLLASWGDSPFGELIRAG
jgi:HAD superfamily hydrolase (TIGR01509 family)